MRCKRWNGRKRIMAAIAVILFLAEMSLGAYAADAKALSTVVYEDSIYIYISGISEIRQDSTIQIGNAICSPEQISAAAFDNLDPFMKTIILVDNSKSIPSKNHGDIQEILQGIVSGAAENEQIKIGTISEGVSYLCDYTNDHNVLGTAINGISYNDQSTYLSDVLYDVISDMKAEGTYACMRLIVLADGADNKSIGYTNDEVRKYIEENAYQVYSIGILGKNNSSELETMFSFSRAAKTDYFLLDGSIPNEEIINALRQDLNGVCLKIIPEESLKDGSTKNILLKLDTAEGQVELTVRVNMPFGTGIAETQPETELQTQEETTAQETLPTLSAKKDEAEEDNKEVEKTGIFQGPLWIFVIAGIIIILLLIVTVVLILLKKRNTKPTPVSREAATAIEEGPIVYNPDTEMTTIGPNIEQDIKEDTAKKLWSKPPKNYLVLRSMNNPQIFYRVLITDVVHIGRGSTEDIVLDDSMVSRKHCEVILRGELLYIKDCGSKNKTYYENMIVYDETPIISGGKVKIGRYTYSIELIKEHEGD